MLECLLVGRLKAKKYLIGVAPGSLEKPIVYASRIPPRPSGAGERLLVDWPETDPNYIGLVIIIVLLLIVVIMVSKTNTVVMLAIIVIEYYL